MSVFSFVKEAGDKVLLDGDSLLAHVAVVGLNNTGIQVTADADRVTATGEASSQEEKEKILLALGNVYGVGAVDDQIIVTGPAATAARFVVVKKGDTLSTISQATYGTGNRYNKIFEGNKPMLTSPDKIYPGQALRIPE